MNVDLARIQFAFTSVNHFFFVPVPIGLAFLTALLQTAWHRSRDDEYLRLTRFFGTLLVINVAIGVVTGLVQEFQFGMDWGAYSRLVGNIFGAPLLTVRGQYEGYLDVAGVAPHSTVETFVAVRLMSDSWRWADVPILIRAGKTMAVTAPAATPRFRH